MIELRHSLDVMHDLECYDSLDRRSKYVIAEVHAVDADMEAIKANEDVECEFVTCAREFW